MVSTTTARTTTATTAGQSDPCPEALTSPQAPCPSTELTRPAADTDGEDGAALLSPASHTKGVDVLTQQGHATRAINARTHVSAGRSCVPARHVLAVLGFLAFFTTYCLRTCLNVAMVAMVNATALSATRHHHHHHHQSVDSLHAYNNGNSNNSNNSSNSNNSGSSNGSIGSSVYYTGYIDDNSSIYSVVSSGGDKPSCAGDWDDVSNTTAGFVEGELVWDERTQGLVLGAFYYGYVLPQVAGGWLADRWRGKRLLGGALLASSLLSLVIPTAARAGPPWVIAVRALQGVVESLCYPAMHVLFSEWIPPQERSRLVVFAFSGSEIGTVGGMLLTGILSRYGFAGGWPSAFYVFGMVGCVWFVLWMVLVFDCPARHPRISESERRYIQRSIGTHEKVKGEGRTPWRALLTSRPVWAVCVAHTCYNWGYYSLLTTLPTFLKHIHHFHIVSNGFLSALPYLLMSVVAVCAGIVCDRLRRTLPLVTVRKIMFTLGCALPACFLVSTGYVQCDHVLAVTLVVIGGSCKGMAATTALINHLDIAPKFAGVMFGVSNTMANIPGFVAPSLIGYLTYDNQTIGQWRKFFYITGAIYGVSALIFLVLGKAECQPWARPQPTCLVITPPADHHQQQQHHHQQEKEKEKVEEKGTEKGQGEGKEEREKRDSVV